ncbi:2TM domain-containing protein [Flavobacterium ardleyense]|uniref:2TM domain-containing protein n=1 Tax=Flavobacterium ardleyense TaxID=2038737 RepID=UPI00298C8B7D|nr:2TM domain-containing protein [Flavobacterium ardleyense]
MENLSAQEQARFERAQKKVKSIKGFYTHFVVYLLVNAFIIISLYLNLDKGEQFWHFSTFSTPLFWGIGLAFHGLNVFGQTLFFGNKWEERKIQEFMNEKQTTKWE